MMTTDELTPPAIGSITNTLQATLLVVDDGEINREIITLLLEPHYRIETANNGAAALRRVAEMAIKPDLILMDIMMPQMDGITACQQLKQDPVTASIPVIFITSRSDDDAISTAYRVGGVDYITKPFRSHEILARISTHLQLAQQQQQLEREVARQTEQLRLLNDELHSTQQEILFTMGAIGEQRSQETGYHVKRVARYSKLIALAAGQSPEAADLLYQASPMHDIGKVAIPDAILNKPARLTPDEFAIMQQHTLLGYEMLRHSQRPLFQLAAEVALTHHEKWDGSGYPGGLAGEQIPIGGRITALVDVYDALSSRRVYKEAFSEDRVLQIIKEGRGGHFDPDLVDLFFNNLDSIREIGTELADRR